MQPQPVNDPIQQHQCANKSLPRGVPMPLSPCVLVPGLRAKALRAATIVAKAWLAQSVVRAPSSVCHAAPKSSIHACSQIVQAWAEHAHTSRAIAFRRCAPHRPMAPHTSRGWAARSAGGPFEINVRHANLALLLSNKQSATKHHVVSQRSRWIQ